VIRTDLKNTFFFLTKVGLKIMYVIILTRRKIRIGIVRSVLWARTWIIRMIHGLSRYIIVKWGWKMTWTRSWVIVIGTIP
jgi:hypothetical protein